MQTFLPYPSFEKSAAVLDRQRLGKQRLEVLNLLETLSGERPGWAHHPATKMWRGHEHALAEYGIAVCEEWIRRGYRDTTLPRIRTYLARFRDTGLPPWFGSRKFHFSHKSNLVRKLPEHYRRYFPKTPPDIPYFWPSEGRSFTPVDDSAPKRG